MADEILTLQEYADEMGISVSGARKQCKSGKTAPGYEPFKAGKDWRLRRVKPEQPLPESLAKLKEEAERAELEERKAKAELGIFDSKQKTKVIAGEIVDGEELIKVQRDIAKREDDLKQRESKLQADKEIMEQQKHQLANDRKDYDDKKKGLDAWVIELDQREAAISEKEAKLEADDKRLDKYAAEIKAGNEKLETARKEFSKEKRKHTALMEHEAMEVKALHDRLSEWVSQWESTNRKSKLVDKFNRYLQGG